MLIFGLCFILLFEKKVILPYLLRTTDKAPWVKRHAPTLLALLHERPSKDNLIYKFNPIYKFIQLDLQVMVTISSKQIDHLYAKCC